MKFLIPILFLMCRKFTTARLLFLSPPLGGLSPSSPPPSLPPLSEDLTLFNEDKEGEYYSMTKDADHAVNNIEDSIAEIKSSIYTFNNRISDQLKSMDDLADRVIIQMNNSSVKVSNLNRS